MPPKIQTTLYEFILEHPEYENLFYEYCDDNEISIYNISCKDAKHIIKWYCPNHNYTWTDYIYNRTKYSNLAPCCAHHVPTPEYNFAVLYPEYVKDWDYEQNTKLPEQYLPFCHDRVYWKCHKCGNKWNTMLTSRCQRLSSCPKCSQAHTSKAEMLLTEYIKKTFPKTSKTKIENTEFDIFIPEIRVAIEYDGYPWHLNKQDTHNKKLDIANRNNFTLINIAEYKNTPEIIQSVKNQYSDKHNVIYYEVKSNYTLDGLLELVRAYFNERAHINLGDMEKEKVTKIITKTASRELGNSLWNSTEVPWIRDWIAPKDIDKAKSITPSSSTDITIKCPNCGREWETKAHWLKKQFRGCSKRSGGCGYTKGLEEQLEASSEGFRRSYNSRADKLKEQRENKKQD